MEKMEKMESEPDDILTVPSKSNGENGTAYSPAGDGISSAWRVAEFAKQSNAIDLFV